MCGSSVLFINYHVLSGLLRFLTQLQQLRRGWNTLHLKGFELPCGKDMIKGDTYGIEKGPAKTLFLHGAGRSTRATFTRLRQTLYERGIPSASFDFIGHGETGGSIERTSLHQRTGQAAAVIRHACSEPVNLIAASMSGYTAIRLTEQFAVGNLILLVPAVYAAHAYDICFGPEFSKVIRVHNSWEESDAFGILSRFTGNLIIIAAESDDVVPREIIERLHASAAHAEKRTTYVVPGSHHRSLFPRREDLETAVNMITGALLAGSGGRTMEVKDSKQDNSATDFQ